MTTGMNDTPALVQLVTPGVLAWAVFESSGDDLYTYLALLSDKRSGAERVEERVCRAYAEWFRAMTYGFAPTVTIDPAACATQERNVVTIAPGKPAPLTWLVFEEHPELKPPGWYPLMGDDGFGTELWVWSFIPLKDGEKPEAESKAPAGFKIDALYWGADLPLLLPK